MGQRVLFDKGKQREFLNLVKFKLNAPSIKGILQFGFNIPYSTLKDYYTESLSLPKEFFDDLCYISKIDSNSLNIKYLENNWGQVKGGRKGIRILQTKYSQEIEKWRKTGQKNSPIFNEKFNLKPIKIPNISEGLAEFIGAYLGDGTLTKYFIRISGNARYEESYYRYLSKLIYNLFGVNSVISKAKNINTLNLRISSKEVCSFLIKIFNLKPGHKIRNRTVIPKQILKDRKLSIACLRGLIDTDGSISKRGNQLCIQFTSYNKSLLNQVYAFGRELGIFTFYDKTGTGTNKWDNILKYFDIVGSSNLKHIVRFHLKKYKNKTIYTRDLNNYFKQDLYRNMNLPFKTLGI